MEKEREFIKQKFTKQTGATLTKDGLDKIMKCKREAEMNLKETEIGIRVKNGRIKTFRMGKMEELELNNEIYNLEKMFDFKILYILRDDVSTLIVGYTGRW